MWYYVQQKITIVSVLSLSKSMVGKTMEENAILKTIYFPGPVFSCGHWTVHSGKSIRQCPLYRWCPQRSFEVVIICHIMVIEWTSHRGSRISWGCVCSVYPFPLLTIERIYILRLIIIINIGSMNYYPLFRVRSWNNGMRCISFYIFILFVRVVDTSLWQNCHWFYYNWGRKSRLQLCYLLN